MPESTGAGAKESTSPEATAIREPPAKLPVQTAPATTGSAAQEPEAVRAEAPAVSEHKE